MITFDQISKLFEFDTKEKFCVEIQFMLIGSGKYDYCYMGKMWGREEQKDAYWYGLTDDGKNAYDYDTFEEMSNAPVFDGHSLKDVWDRVVIETIDGCDPEERIGDYLNAEKGASRMSAPLEASRELWNSLHEGGLRK